MEIRDYLRVLRRRLLLLILLPLLAVGGVALYLLVRPATYTATATVAAPALVGGAQSNQYSGANGTKTFVANYTAALTSPVIVDKVAEATKVRPSDISSGLTALPINDGSSLLKVTFRTHKKAQAEPVVQEAAGATLAFLFQTQSDLAKQQLEQGQKALDETTSKLTTFERANGVLLDQVYQADVQAVNSLRQQQLTQQAQGNTGGAAVLATQVKAAEVRLAQRAPKVAEYLTLTSSVTRAQDRLNAAQLNAASAEAQLSAADPSRTVSVAATNSGSKVAQIIKGGIVAGAAALFLAIGLVLLLELLDRSPGRKPEDTPTPRPTESVATRL